MTETLAKLTARELGGTARNWGDRWDVLFEREDGGFIVFNGETVVEYQDWESWDEGVENVTVHLR